MSGTLLKMRISWSLALLLGHELCSAQQTQIATMLLPDDIINSMTDIPTAFTGSATSSDGTTSFSLDCHDLRFCGNSPYKDFEVLSFNASGGWTYFDLSTE